MDGLRPVDDDIIVDDDGGAYTKVTLRASSGIDPSGSPLTKRGTSGDDYAVVAGGDMLRPNMVKDGRDFERWLFSDWLNRPTNGKEGRRKEPALPILKDAKWNSGDNPVLVTAAM